MSNLKYSWQLALDHLETLKKTKVISDLKKADTSVDRIKACLSDSTAVNFIGHWLLEAVEEKHFQKNVLLSKCIRLEGNHTFTGSYPVKALTEYNRAVRYAPVNSEEYYLAYANRSAVLFHCGKYEECLEDIENSLNVNEDFLKLKLLVRKGKALNRLGRIFSSKVILEETKRFLSNLSLDKKCNEKAVKLVNDLEKELCSTSCVPTITQQKSEPLSEILPEPTEGFNKLFPSASNLIELRENKAKGRYVVASKDIKVGDILFVEKPISFVVLPEFSESYCQNCCKESHIIVPCSSCCEAVFCSLDCLSTAWNSYHKWECPKGISICYSIGIAHLAFRMALMDLSKASLSKLNPALSLINHLDSMSPSDLYQYSMTSICLGIYMQKYHSLNEEETLNFSSRVLEHIAELVCNGHAIMKLQTSDSQDLTTEADTRIATGIYPAASKMNHSCTRQIANCFYNQYLIVKAVQDIPAGEEVYNNYGIDWSRMDRDERLQSLREQYMFVCDCSACTAPIDPGLKFHAFRCVKCCGPIFKGRCIDCKSCYDVLEFQFELDNLKKRFVDLSDSFDSELLNGLLLEAQNVLYRNHKFIAEIRDSMAMSLIQSGNYFKGFEALEECLKDVKFRFGSNSAEVCNEIIKICSVILMLISKKSSVLTPEQYRNIISRGPKYFDESIQLIDLHYGSWVDKFRVASSERTLFLQLIKS